MYLKTVENETEKDDGLTRLNKDFDQKDELGQSQVSYHKKKNSEFVWNNRSLQ